MAEHALTRLLIDGGVVLVELLQGGRLVLGGVGGGDQLLGLKVTARLQGEQALGRIFQGGGVLLAQLGEVSAVPREGVAALLDALVLNGGGGARSRLLGGLTEIGGVAVVGK